MKKIEINKIAKEVIDNYNQLREMEVKDGKTTRKFRIRTRKNRDTDSY